MSLSRDILLGNRKVYICYDYDNDRNYRSLLFSLTKNSRFSLSFSDDIFKDFIYSDIGNIKAALAKKIGESTHTLVVVGKDANTLHRDHNIIGHKNWFNYEIAKSKEFGKKIVAVKIDPKFESPEQLLSSKVKWVKSLNIDEIIDAIDNR